MWVLESAATFDLPDSRVWVAGDWHGNTGWARTLLPALRRIDPGVSTLLHAGDWSMEPGTVDLLARDTGITRMLVTTGNHEPWDQIRPLLDAHPGEAIRVSDVVWILPRPAQFRMGGVSFVSLGGAASVDRLLRTEGLDWWPDERISDDHVEAALRMRADVMVTHEPPDGTPVREARKVLDTNPGGWPEETLRESAESRRRVDRVWNALKPGVLFHGHLHVYGNAVTEDGRRVVSLGRDVHVGNVHLLELPSLRTESIPMSVIRRHSYG